MNKHLVILPTYNEIINIKKIIPAVLNTCPEVDILVVDDNSPDGTGTYIKEELLTQSNIHLLERKKKEGLGRAYLAGINWAINNGYDFLTQMDADFSHRTEDLKRMILASKDYDLIIGSRWVPGGKVVNWTLFRKFISRFGSLYASIILQKKLKDWTGGFNLWRCSKLKEFNFSEIQSNGYSFQIEMKSLALDKKFRYFEQPITFIDRVEGNSKMSKKIIIEALIKVWSFR